MASFCANCGNKLNEGERYCVKCGYDTETPGGGDNFIRYDPSPNTGPQLSARRQKIGDILNVIYWFGILWGVIAIMMFLGYTTLFSLGSSYNYWFFFEISGLLLLAVAIIFLASGILAILCCMNLNKLLRHQQACNLCLIGSLIAIIAGAFSYGIVGIIFYIMIKKEGYRFHSSSVSIGSTPDAGSSNYSGGFDQYYSYQNKDQHGLNQTLMIIMTLGFVWGFGSLATPFGLATIGNQNPDELLVFFYLALVIIGLASGILALLCCINIYNLENHKQACTYCLIGSILALPLGLVPGIIGILFYSQLKDEKHRFRS